MARTWLINASGIAKKIRNATRFPEHQAEEVGAEARRECPNCKHTIDNSDVSLEWPGLPAGVKFDPSDVEILEHLAGKTGQGNVKSHLLIDEFIPTLDGDLGICYTHPENLPGIKKDGSSVLFFHKISNAYSRGHRKRRKTYGEFGVSDSVRWHKTGKSKIVLENGVKKGWKKIMVLYRASSGGCKPDKVKWVMHQYHLGEEEDERDGEVVVSKIFYQQRPNQADDKVVCIDPSNEEVDAFFVRCSPRTPKTNPPRPARPNSSSPDDEFHEFNMHLTQDPGYEPLQTPSPPADPNPQHSSRAIQDGKDHEDPRISIDVESLLCNEALDSFAPYEAPSDAYFGLGTSNNSLHAFFDHGSATFDFDTPSDLSLADLQFGSQDSITSWLDRL